MPANKFGSYIVNYRSRRKEEAEQERQRRLEDAKRAPKIIDPSFELFGHQSPQDYEYEDSLSHNTTKSPAASPEGMAGDWMFQNRRASAMPQPYQFEPYCEVTPKSSVSSSTSASSDARPIDYDMGWDTANTIRPRPQSHLPSSMSKIHTMSMSDLHRASAYRSRRHSGHAEPPQPSQAEKPSKSSRPAYGLGASLTKPFSIDDPFDAFDGPESQNATPVSTQAPYDLTWETTSTTLTQERDRTPRPSR